MRDGDANALTDRAREVIEAATGAPPPLDYTEHGLIVRTITRAVVTEVVDENTRPTAEQREAIAVATAKANAMPGPLTARIRAAGARHGSAEKAG